MGAKVKKKEKKENAQTFLPTDFWLKMIHTMDTKTKYIAEGYGYGKIQMEFTVHHGKVKYVVFNDEIRVRTQIDDKEQKILNP